MYSLDEMRVICEVLLEEAWHKEKQAKSEYEVTEEVCEEAEDRYGLEMVVDDVYREKGKNEPVSDNDDIPFANCQECKNLTMLMTPDDRKKYERNEAVDCLIVIDMNNYYDYDDVYIARIDGNKILSVEGLEDW